MKKGRAQLELPGVRPASIDAEAFAPALARRVDAPPVGDWLHEPKLDGYRLLCAVAGRRVRLWSRNAIEWTDRVPHIARAVGALGATSLRLDGELVAVAPRKRGGTDFGLLQAALTGAGDAALRYVVFDVLHVDGNDLSDVPLRERKRVLSALLARGRDDVLLEGEWREGDGAALYQRWVKAGYEGIVSKRADSRYRGGRGGEWTKVRAREAEELAVVGYTEPRGRRVGIGALLMARPIGGGRWAYAGRVGTGMGQRLLEELGRLLPGLVRKTPPVVEESLELPRAAGDLRGVRWIDPQLAIEVEHSGQGNGGLLRQPALKTLRLDKRASDLERERAADRRATRRARR
jgi:bifunctional non-homologous end joining protein LigD